MLQERPAGAMVDRPVSIPVTGRCAMIGTRRLHRIPLGRVFVVLALSVAVLLGALAGRSVARAQTDPGFAVGEAVVVEADGLNLRADAGVDADVLALLPDGTIGVVADGPVTADNYVWYQLDIDGTLGWSAADWLSLALSEHTVMAIGTEAIVTADALNLRADATTSADVVTTVAAGSTATVLDGPVTADGYDWYQLDADGNTGWAVRDYLAFAPQSDAAIAIGDTATVNTDGLNLRDDATLDANVIVELTSGEQVTILDGPVEADGWTWFQVEATAGTGWVVGEYLIV
jgi:uncharacterized protein YgiM (DUF1202 family)